MAGALPLLFRWSQLRYFRRLPLAGTHYRVQTVDPMFLVKERDIDICLFHGGEGESGRPTFSTTLQCGNLMTFETSQLIFSSRQVVTATSESFQLRGT